MCEDGYLCRDPRLRLKHFGKDRVLQGRGEMRAPLEKSRLVDLMEGLIVVANVDFQSPGIKQWLQKRTYLELSNFILSKP
jgi:hypothetical protein